MDIIEAIGRQFGADGIEQFSVRDEEVRLSLDPLTPGGGEGALRIEQFHNVRDPRAIAGQGNPERIPWNW
jgi:hypothetical protein